MSERARLGALITAAGASERMAEPKALLDWGGRTLLAHQILALDGFAEIVVVLGADAERVGAEDLGEAVRTVVNARWAEGRSTSLAAGARALERSFSELDGVLVAGVDQPLETEVVDALVAALVPDQDAALIPAWRGQRGHPVLLGRQAMAALAEVARYPEGLRGFLAAYQATTRTLPVTSRGVLLDLNTPEDYARATARFSA